MGSALPASQSGANALRSSTIGTPAHAYPEWFGSARACFEQAFQPLVSSIAARPGLASLVPDAVNPGRRIRPALYCALSRVKSPGTALAVTDMLPALAIELFHAASIIVDDISDGEERRRDKSPFFRLYDEDTAIVLSHLLMAEGGRLLAQHPASSTLLEAWSRAYAEAAEGQALDLRWFRPFDVLETQRLSLRKTSAFFGFIGDALASTSREDFGDLGDRLREVGECFQISNDVVDLLYFGRSGRHDPSKSYVLRPSYLVPRLIAAELLDRKHVFEPLPFLAHQRLSDAARQLIPDAPQFLVKLFEPLQHRLATSRLIPGHRQILSEFVAQTTHVSFWLHTHAN